IVATLALAGGAAANQAWLAAVVLGTGATLVLARALVDQGRAVSAVERVIAALEATALAEDKNVAWDAEMGQVAGRRRSTMRLDAIVPTERTPGHPVSARLPRRARAEAGASIR